MGEKEKKETHVNVFSIKGQNIMQKGEAVEDKKQVKKDINIDIEKFQKAKEQRENIKKKNDVEVQSKDIDEKKETITREEDEPII